MKADELSEDKLLELAIAGQELRVREEQAILERLKARLAERRSTTVLAAVSETADGASSPKKKIWTPEMKEAQSATMREIWERRKKKGPPKK